MEWLFFHEKNGIYKLYIIFAKEKVDELQVGKELHLIFSR